MFFNSIERQRRKVDKLQREHDIFYGPVKIAELHGSLASDEDLLNWDAARKRLREAQDKLAEMKSRAN